MAMNASGRWNTMNARTGLAYPVFLTHGSRAEASMDHVVQRPASGRSLTRTEPLPKFRLVRGDIPSILSLAPWFSFSGGSLPSQHTTSPTRTRHHHLQPLSHSLAQSRTLAPTQGTHEPRCDQQAQPRGSVGVIAGRTGRGVFRLTTGHGMDCDGGSTAS